MTERGKVVLVAARATNGVIGLHGDIPWHIPADFAHFKATTLGHTYPYGEIPLAHQLMGDGQLPEGNVSCLVNAAEPGLKTAP